MQNKSKRDFDSMSTTWDEEPRRVKLSGEIANTIKKHVPFNTTMSLLDYGCGTGLVSLQLYGEVKSVTGLDSSQGMLDVFNQKIAHAGIESISLNKISDDGTTEITGSYDVIVSTMTLHHVKEPAKLIELFASHLKPGGYICLADLDSEDGKFHDDNAGVLHNGFDRKIITQWLAEVGLVKTEIVTASVIRKSKGLESNADYPVFLAISRKP